MTYVKERIPNGFRTVNSAEFCANNAYNGFDFASRSQPPVERAAHQALAREKTLPKSASDTTPTAIMAGPGSVIRCARKRRRFRARERRQSGGRGNAERNCLSPAPVRGRWVIDPSPAMITTTTPITGMLEEERFVSRKDAKPQRSKNFSHNETMEQWVRTRRREAPLMFDSALTRAGSNFHRFIVTLCGTFSSCFFAALRLCGKQNSSCARLHGLKTRTTQ
jgi:hypothetical protein